MRTWMMQVVEWLRAFPRPNRTVTIRGDVLDGGGEITVGPGVHLIVEGNVKVPNGRNVAIRASGDVTICGALA